MTPKINILLIEDDKSICNFIRETKCVILF